LAGVGGTIGKICRWKVSDESESRLDKGEDRLGVTDERSRCGFGVFGSSHGPLSSEEVFCSSILLEGIVLRVGLSARVIRSVPSAFLSFHSAAQLDRLIDLGVRFGTVVNLSSNGIPPSERWTVCFLSGCNLAGEEDEVPMGNDNGINDFEAFHDNLFSALISSSSSLIV
jgi:hypothetical protein